ncbi:ninjurin-2-like isoform X1 [Macrobrachium rosenbergii]|uniref:ninjurin-2-like isoform X1 n=1 Tax=Macrobrachium rosenbergii TaxID=79674 RepID=UPI0034D5262B
MYGQLFTQPSYNNNGDPFNGKMNDPQVMTVGGGKTLDPNKYATKKTIAQGMLDIALLTANASQLKYVLQLGKGYEFYSVMLGLIITSLVLQLVAAALSLTLTMCRDCNLHDESYRLSALTINHFNLICVSLIAVLNIIISAFGITPSDIQVEQFTGE